MTLRRGRKGESDDEEDSEEEREAAASLRKRGKGGKGGDAGSDEEGEWCGGVVKWGSGAWGQWITLASARCHVGQYKGSTRCVSWSFL